MKNVFFRVKPGNHLAGGDAHRFFEVWWQIDFSFHASVGTRLIAEHLLKAGAPTYVREAILIFSKRLVVCAARERARDLLDVGCVVRAANFVFGAQHLRDLVLEHELCEKCADADGRISNRKGQGCTFCVDARQHNRLEVEYFVDEVNVTVAALPIIEDFSV